MAIAQDRMIRLAKAGKTCLDRLEQIVAKSIELSSRLAQGTLTPAQSNAEMTTFIEFSRPPYESACAINEELYHFKKFAARNTREKERVARKRERGELGGPRQAKRKQSKPDSTIRVTTPDPDAFNDEGLGDGESLLIASLDPPEVLTSINITADEKATLDELAKLGFSIKKG